MQNTINEAEKFLSTSNTLIDSQTLIFTESQKNLEFWTEFADMLSEKNIEIQNAKEKLLELKTKYFDKKTTKKWEEINDGFLDTDGINVLGFSEKDPSAEINMHSEKLAARMKLLVKTTKKFKNDDETRNNESFNSSDDSGDEEFNKTKDEFFDAVDEILREIEEEFKFVPSLIKSFNSLPKEFIFSFLGNFSNFMNFKAFGIRTKKSKSGSLRF